MPKEAQQKAPFIRSELLSTSGIVAGFSTALGGDDPAHLALAAGFRREQITTVTQVHGSTICEVGAEHRPEDFAAKHADGLVTTIRGPVLTIKTADCVPVLLSDGATVVAAVHAGWRGLVAGIVSHGVEAVTRKSGAPPESIHAAVGPAIRSCCFEVSDEVATQIAQAARSDSVIRPTNKRPFVDLHEATTRCLQASGMISEHIEVVRLCTKCEEDQLHSYRRQGPRSGRQLSFIGMI